MRIEAHPILEFRRGKKVAFTFDGEELQGYDNETVAVALHAAGVRRLSQSLHKKRARGFYCAIGNCSACLMTVDGRPNVKTCLELLREGMVVETQLDKGKLV